MKDSKFEELTEEELAIVAGGCGKSRKLHCSRKVFEEDLETLRICTSSSPSLSIVERTYRTQSTPVTITIKYRPEIDRYT